MSETQIAHRVRDLRDRMARDGLDFYLVPSTDDHQNEYLPERWQRRRWISGFTGSSGDALIGRDRAWLWTDARYWLQAEKELDPGVYELQRQGQADVAKLEKWLEKNAGQAILGVDPRVISIQAARDLEVALGRVGAELRGSAPSYVDALWIDRPPVPRGTVTLLATRYSGRTVQEKLAEIRAGIDEQGCDAHALSALDAIAWTFNLRGSDVDYNPLLISYALISRDQAVLFSGSEMFGPEIRSHLSQAGVEIEPYDAFGDALAGLSGRVLLDPALSSRWMADQLARSDASCVEAASPVTLLKARKNPTEQVGMRAAHLRDGVAVVRFLCWLECAALPGPLDELRAADKLDALRREGERFRDLSFPTISGFAANGAIVHYRATEASSRKIDDSAPYLIDSGAHYLDGTTDVTRTVHLGRPTAIQREHYTRVLRGHLALARAVFPKGTTGAQLDALARTPLWEVGLDYGHGTGHGVGCYLNVHEGPQGISSRATKAALEPGMVVSNEPGLYLADRYGIRIENLCLVVEVQQSSADSASPFYRFENLTLVPYCRRLIDPGQLDRRERDEIDAYHARVLHELEPHLQEPEQSWLREETLAL